VYYACITGEEAEEFKLRHDDEGYYTRSTKIQAAVQAYIELPGKEERQGERELLQHQLSMVKAFRGVAFL
jgi:hypothetical protein